MEAREYIENKVRQLYREQNMNCARTTLTCLSELLNTPVNEQTFASAIGMHGAGGFRAQCGLVEGGLMFIGLYFDAIGKSEREAVKACYKYAVEFTEKFGSLTCRELRPQGFSKDNPPHLCEKLTFDTIEFTYQFILKLTKE